MADSAPETKSSRVNLRWFLALLITLIIFALVAPAITAAWNARKQTQTA